MWWVIDCGFKMILTGGNVEFLCKMKVSIWIQKYWMWEGWPNREFFDQKLVLKCNFIEDGKYVLFLYAQHLTCILRHGKNSRHSPWRRHGEGPPRPRSDMVAKKVDAALTLNRQKRRCPGQGDDSGWLEASSNPSNSRSLWGFWWGVML